MDSRARAHPGPKSQVQKLGRYYLLNRIAQGGFAEVYRGVLDAGGGVHRLVAIKCLHSDHGAESEFSRAFRSEIKVSLGLTHPNIVPTYDFGSEDGRPYIVFEYIHGRSLRQVLTRMAEHSRVLSVEHAAFIIEQSAAALHYAHTFRDPISRDPIEIIHRDVSPQNILLSFDGVPKIIDFGIAKVMAAAAEATEDRTRTGVIKGKPAYLSPEQIRGDTLDGRSDVFALGIVLWETLTGVRLFGGKDHSIAIQAIMDTSFRVEPPSNINPAVPQELDQIVLMALARSREDRMRNARDLQNSLMKFLNRADGAKSRDQYQGEISDILSDIFAEELVEDQSELKRLNDAVMEIAQTEGRRQDGQPREFSLEELSIIQKNRGHTFEDTTKTERDTKSNQTTTEHNPGPPARFGKTLVMIQMPEDLPNVPLEGPVNKGMMPEPQPPPKPFVKPDDPATEPMTPVPRITPPAGAPARMRAPVPPPPKAEPQKPEIKPDAVPLGRPEGVPIFKPAPQPLTPQQPKAADPRRLPPVEKSVSGRITRSDLGPRPDFGTRAGTRRIEPQPSYEQGPRSALGRILLILAGLMIALLLLQKLIPTRTGLPFRERTIENETPLQNPSDSSRPEKDGGKKTFEPETAPEYKDYSVPPIDIVPGGSRR